MTTIYIAEPVGYVRPERGNLCGFWSLECLREALEPIQEKALNFFEVTADGPITAFSTGEYYFRSEYIHSCAKVGTLPLFKPAFKPRTAKRAL